MVILCQTPNKDKKGQLKKRTHSYLIQEFTKVLTIVVLKVRKQLTEKSIPLHLKDQFKVSIRVLHQ